MKTTAFVLILFCSPAYAASLPEWMAGAWGGETGGVVMEEHWTNTNGGLMLGMHRDVKQDTKTHFEFLRIEQQGETLVYQAMPGGRPTTPFPLKTIEKSRVVFENLQHDFPQRIIYWRKDKQLCARVEGTIGGKEESEEWCWNRLPK